VTTPPDAQPTDLELLRIQQEMVLDTRGRIEHHSGITVAAAPDGQLLFVGSEVADALAARLRDAFARADRVGDPAVEPAALAECERLLRAEHPDVRRRSGPYYVIPPGTHLASAAEITVSTCDDAAAAAFRHRNPGNWEPAEWLDLVDGRLGPWAMATVHDHVVSICHTPRRMTDRAAECGVWTMPEFRGQGHAAAATAAWASIARGGGRHLFYSTDAENRSSRRVASRLGLRLIGWTWGLVTPVA